MQHAVGDEDDQLVCPRHLLPLKLLRKSDNSGLVLDSYEYVCLGVLPSGKACGHKALPDDAASGGHVTMKRGC
jgi:hypothetical protein